MNVCVAILASFLFGFVIGAGAMLDSWTSAAERGAFEIGHKIYRVEQVDVVRPGVR